ncbi:CIC11C00000000614 [Sungouiella intermedia]|uniref:Probable transporter MCH1 n=1 Tax=Sungouiella intermedia TaxID=45354 RepID=A0A1L0BWV5_9ASCO|nr:CIC11C00000000614 [[Candida] intermedia]
MKHLHRFTHKIKNALASRYDLVHLKRLAFAIALTSCLSLGSIMLFSLFALALHNSVGLSYTQINFIVSLSAVGMYLCLPVLGYLADCYGPALLSLISIWAFCPAYFVNAIIVRLVSTHYELLPQLTPGNVAVLAVSFCFIGLATSSLYFASLLTCARIYPNHKSLAISMPVSCYGLSTLIGSQIMKLGYFHELKNELDLYRVFLFFAFLYLVVGILNFVSNSIVSLEQEVIFGETEPLLSDSETSVDCSSISDSSLTPVRSQRSALEPVDHHSRFIAFLKDKSAWVFLLSLMLNVGPLESFQNNLGLIIQSTSSGNVQLTDQVSIIAALSTIIRLLIGVVADWISSEDRKHPVCKVWLLVGLTLIGTVGQFGVLYFPDFAIVSVLNGISYGGLFTTYPTIIASIWGVDLMGSTWGSFMVAPAVGSIVFSLMHGHEMDSCTKSTKCLSRYFQVTGVSMFLSTLCILFVWRIMWWRRGLKCF